MDIKLPERIKNAIAETKKNVEQIYKNNLEGIILYGSYARGDYNDSSDIDILITLKKMESISKEREKYIDTTSNVSLKYDTVITILPVEVDVYEENKIPIFMNIHKEGIRI